MTEFLRELMYPSGAAGFSLDELYGRLKPFMYVPVLQQDLSTKEPLYKELPTKESLTKDSSTKEPLYKELPTKELPTKEPVSNPILPTKEPVHVVKEPVVKREPPVVKEPSVKREPVVKREPSVELSIPPIIVPPPTPQKGFTSILWCAYTVAHGGTELNIPLSLLAREERKIREDCLNRVSPAMVKQRFGFLTLSQIQSLLQEIQKTNKLAVESPATWYIWAVYYATMPTVQLVFGRTYIVISSESPTTVQILYDKTRGIMRVVNDVNVSGLFQITNLLKPLNGVGSYTLLDLKQMAIQLELPVATSAKKTALYETIGDYIRTVIT